MRHLLFLLISTLAAAAVCWLAGFAMFLWQLPSQSEQYSHPAVVDGIVILTGGSLRIDEGIELLEQQAAGKLLISGVGEGVTLNEILNTLDRKLPPDVVERIEIGHEARDTHGNAEEAEEWVRKNNIHSLIMVTAYYHEPRAMMEFRHKLAGVKIYPHPVFPEAGGGLRVLVQEYHKMIYHWWL